MSRLSPCKSFSCSAGSISTRTNDDAAVVLLRDAARPHNAWKENRGWDWPRLSREQSRAETQRRTVPDFPARRGVGGEEGGRGGERQPGVVGCAYRSGGMGSRGERCVGGRGKRDGGGGRVGGIASEVASKALSLFLPAGKRATAQARKVDDSFGRAGAIPRGSYLSGCDEGSMCFILFACPRS